MAVIAQVRRNGIDEGRLRGSIIEFYGLPGAGKSRVSRELCDLLNESRGVYETGGAFFDEELPRMSRNLLRFALIARELPGSFGNLGNLWRAFSVPQETLKDKLKAVYNLWTIHSLVLRTVRRNDLLVLDQGITQAIWSLYLKSDASPELAKWFARLAPDGIIDWRVVVLNCDEVCLIERLRNRASSHTRFIPPEPHEDSKTWSKGKRLNEALVRWLSSETLTTNLSVSSHSNSCGVNPQDVAHEIYRVVIE